MKVDLAIVSKILVQEAAKRVHMPQEVFNKTEESEEDSEPISTDETNSDEKDVLVNGQDDEKLVPDDIDDVLVNQIQKLVFFGCIKRVYEQVKLRSRIHCP